MVLVEAVVATVVVVALPDGGAVVVEPPLGGVEPPDGAATPGLQSGPIGTPVRSYACARWSAATAATQRT